MARSTPENTSPREAGENSIEAVERSDCVSQWRRDVSPAKKDIQRILVLAKVDRLLPGQQQVNRKSIASIRQSLHDAVVGGHDHIDLLTTDNFQYRIDEPATFRCRA